MNWIENKAKCKSCRKKRHAMRYKCMVGGGVTTTDNVMKKKKTHTFRYTIYNALYVECMCMNDQSLYEQLLYWNWNEVIGVFVCEIIMSVAINNSKCAPSIAHQF